MATILDSANLVEEIGLYIDKCNSKCIVPSREGLKWENRWCLSWVLVLKLARWLRGERVSGKNHHKIIQTHVNLLRTKNSNNSLATKPGCEILSINSIFLMIFTKLVFKLHSYTQFLLACRKNNARMFLSLFEYYTSKCACEIQIGIHGRKMAQFKFTFN